MYEIAPNDKAALSQVVEEGISLYSHVVVPESLSAARTAFDVAALVLGLVTVMVGAVLSIPDIMLDAPYDVLPAESVEEKQIS